MTRMPVGQEDKSSRSVSSAPHAPVPHPPVGVIGDLPRLLRKGTDGDADVVGEGKPSCGDVVLGGVGSGVARSEQQGGGLARPFGPGYG